MTVNPLLHSFLDTLDEGIFLLGRDGTLETANSTALGLLGVHRDELAGQSVFNLITGSDIADALKSCLETGTRRAAASARLIRKSPPALAIDWVLDPLPNDDGPVCAALRFRPLDAQGESCGIALQSSEAKLRVILDTIVDAVVVADEHGIIQLLNPAAEHLFGYRREEIIGGKVNVLMPEPDQSQHDRYIADFLRTGVRKIIGIGREVTGKRKDGSQFPLYLSIGETATGEGRIFVAVLRDLSERKQAEVQLMTLSSAVEQSPNAILITDVNGTVEYVNPSFSRLTGYSREDVYGKSPSILQSGHTPDAIYQELWQALQEGRPWHGEIEDRKKNGETYWALQTISPLRDARGQATRFLSIQQDITAIKKDKEALQESELRFRQVAEMSGEWLWEQDPEGRYTYSSAAVTSILGYTPEEITGKGYLDLLTEQDREHWNQELAPLPDVHRPFFHLVNRYRHRDGHEVFTESTGEPIFSPSGKLLKWRGVDHNITSRKRYEDALRLRDRAIEAASVGIDIVDARGGDYPSIYVNPALCRITGYSNKELLGKNLRLLQGPDTDQEAVRKISQSLREGSSCEVVLKNYRKDGSGFWNSLVISPVHDEEGNLTHYIGVQTDVTELRHASEERQELEIAKQIQLSLLPKHPLQADTLQVAGVCLPASHVGGDYYDYFFAGANLEIVIADVSGHSVGAALIMAETRSALKAAIHRGAANKELPKASEMLCALNDLLHDDLNGADLFISMFYLSFDPVRRLLHYANAGHNRPLLLRHGEARCRQLDAEGMIFGVHKEIVFEEKIEQLGKGDRLLLYTDGVVEAQDPNGNFFGVSRLCASFSALKDESPQTVIRLLLEQMRAFCGGESFNDDVSIVVLNIE